MALLNNDVTTQQIAEFLRRDQTQRHQAGVQQKSSDMIAGVTALPYRALGAPVDMMTMLARPFGYSVPDAQVVGGSDWLLEKAKAAGLHTGVPQSTAGQIGDFLGQLATPGAGPGEAKLAAGLPEMAKAMFAGFTAARGAPMDALRAAEEMATARQLSRLPVGSPEWLDANRAIHAQTGVHFGYDMHPRWEFSDREADVRTALEGDMQRADFLAHPQLDQAYPASRGLPATIKPAPAPGAEAGAMDFNVNRMTVEAPLNRRRPIALHELQHYIQRREGFDAGAAPSMYPGDPDQQLRQYASNWGEMEARATEARRNLTDAERRARFPLDDYRWAKGYAPNPSPVWGPAPARNFYGLLDD